MLPCERILLYCFVLAFSCTTYAQIIGTTLVKDIEVVCRGDHMAFNITYNDWHQNGSALFITGKPPNYIRCIDLQFVPKATGSTQYYSLNYSSCPFDYHSTTAANKKFLVLELTLETHDPLTVLGGPYVNYNFTAKCEYRIETIISFSSTLYGASFVQIPSDGTPSLTPRPNPHLESASDRLRQSTPVHDVTFPPNSFSGNGDDISGLSVNLLASQADPKRNLTFAYQGLAALLKINLKPQESYTKIIPSECYFSENEDPKDYTVIASFITDSCPDSSINQFATVVTNWAVANDTSYQVYYNMLNFDKNPTVYLHCWLNFCIPMDNSCNAVNFTQTEGCPWSA